LFHLIIYEIGNLLEYMYVILIMLIFQKKLEEIMMLYLEMLRQYNINATIFCINIHRKYMNYLIFNNIQLIYYEIFSKK